MRRRDPDLEGTGVTPEEMDAAMRTAQAESEAAKARDAAAAYLLARKQVLQEIVKFGVFWPADFR